MAGALEGLAGILIDAAGLTDPDRSSEPPSDPLVGAVLVRDTDLPRVAGSAGLLAVSVSGGAGQLAGPARLCSRKGLALGSITVELRDPLGLAANAQRVVAAVDDARSSGALHEDVVVRVGLPPAPPGPEWLRAADEIAGAELEAELSLGTEVDAGAAAGWIDALLDRETAFAARTGGDAGSVLSVLTATAAAWEGAGTDEVARLLGRPATEVPERDVGRRWCRALIVPDATGTAEELRSRLPG